MIELLLQAERAMDVGLVDQAERLYRQAIAADPRNSIAVVGLARVALERGDEAGALWHARRALAIDPDNAAAQRLVDRMVEVITARRGSAPATAASASAASMPAGDSAPARGSAPPSEPLSTGPPDPASAGQVSPAPAPPPSAPPGRRCRRSLLRRLTGRG